jgi:hypothetical protein
MGAGIVGFDYAAGSVVSCVYVDLASGGPHLSDKNSLRKEPVDKSLVPIETIRIKEIANSLAFAAQRAAAIVDEVPTAPFLRYRSTIQITIFFAAGQKIWSLRWKFGDSSL